MKSSRTVSHRRRVAKSPKRSIGKATNVAPYPNEEAGQPEGPVWGHWFNTEGMQINNTGSPSEVRKLDMQ
jgi:hypothetical protein